MVWCLGLFGSGGCAGVRARRRVGGQAAAGRANWPLLWLTPRWARRTRLTAAALLVSHRWLAATPR